MADRALSRFLCCFNFVLAIAVFCFAIQLGNTWRAVWNLLLSASCLAFAWTLFRKPGVA